MNPIQLNAARVAAAALCLTAYAAQAQTTVNFGSTEQTIRGFGGSTAFLGEINNTDANALFSNGDDQQMGLSLLRIRIDPGGEGNWGTELSNAQMAAARGASIFATPWTPPASMKSNGSTIGGSLLTADYAAYATYLKSFVTYMSNNGAPLYAISMQNEPDANVDYESCTWTAAQMETWVANNASAVGSKLIMPESEGFNTAYSDPSLNNSTADSNISIVGGHLYGTSPFYYTNAKNKGKDVWMTEHYLTGLTISNAMTMAKEITDSMSIAQYNAYVWWYVKDNNIGLVNSNDYLTILGYTMGQWAKFVRPGYQMVRSTYNPSTSIYTTAFTGSGHYAIVAINTGSSAVNEKFTLSGATITSLIPYQTSNTESMEQLATVTVTGDAFTYSLPAQSITTFYK
jgi:glucuronoarabinoxylan endo-1,4-beta-xylanase